MGKQKTRKSILKRFKITKTGKVLRRKTRQDHYRQKQTGKQRRKGRKWVALSPFEVKRLKKVLGL